MFSEIVIIFMFFIPIVIVTSIITCTIAISKKHNKEFDFNKFIKKTYIYLVLIIFIFVMIGSFITVFSYGSEIIYPEVNATLYFNQNNSDINSFITSLVLFIISSGIVIYYSRLSNHYNKSLKNRIEEIN